MSTHLKAIVDSNCYRIVRKIADGGMGTVYEGVQEGANGFAKTVAIKTIAPRFSEDARIVDMFIQEAKLVANLVHESIVQIYQLGRTEDEGWYIVMEYVRGLTLHDFLRFHHVTGMQLPVELSVFIVSRIARALAYAHTRVDPIDGHPLNIVHRDVCPHNILITTEGLPKLTDFGVAKARNHALADSLDGLLGKFAYMSPEQSRREETDFRADHYALGAVLFELIAGESIRSGTDDKEILAQARGSRVKLSKLPKSCPPMIRDLLKKALNRNPSKRFETTSQMAQSLEYFIYKDGYGPTVQTLETYLKTEFPYLYHPQNASPNAPASQAGPLPPTVSIAKASTMFYEERD